MPAILGKLRYFIYNVQSTSLHTWLCSQISGYSLIKKKHACTETEKHGGATHIYIYIYVHTFKQCCDVQPNYRTSDIVKCMYNRLGDVCMAPWYVHNHLCIKQDCATCWSRQPFKNECPRASVPEVLEVTSNHKFIANTIYWCWNLLPQFWCLWCWVHGTQCLLHGVRNPVARQHRDVCCHACVAIGECVRYQSLLLWFFRRNLLPDNQTPWLALSSFKLTTHLVLPPKVTVPTSVMPWHI